MKRNAAAGDQLQDIETYNAPDKLRKNAAAGDQLQDIETYNAAANSCADPALYDPAILKNNILDCISNYELENNISVLSIKQLQWNSVLETIAIRIIKPLHINFKDIDLLNTIADIYLSICRFYNKTSSLYGYSIISTIPYNTLISYRNNSEKNSIYIDIDNNNRVINNKGLMQYRIKHNNNRIIELFNTDYIELAKRIAADREHALTDRTEEGSVMSLALGKIEFSWIESAKEKMQVETMQNYTLPQDILKEYSENN